MTEEESILLDKLYDARDSYDIDYIEDLKTEVSLMEFSNNNIEFSINHSLGELERRRECIRQTRRDCLSSIRAVLGNMEFNKPVRFYVGDVNVEITRVDSNLETGEIAFDFSNLLK